ncbi:arginine decarboxylase [Acinetobacter calcoaceticus]|uniref:Arginine decarboxylase n=1 Tax=Acinetobacter calcoaceticus TaxID=471 RepID=A0A4V2R177_ACICA|nr:arginine decarboxylase [Acinetobacter calcoaceticus]
MSFEERLSSVSADNIFTITTIRTDLWRELVKISKQCVAIDQDQEKEQLVRKYFNTLANIEKLHAYPGRFVIQQLKELLDNHRFEAFNELVAKVSFSIISNQYKDDIKQWEHDQDLSYSEDIKLDEKPYFEVLIVASGNIERIEKHVKLLQKQKRKEDDFFYEPVIVDSLEDAFCAVATNSNINSVVIFEGISLKSSSQLVMLESVMQQLNVNPDLENLELELAQGLVNYRPELDIFLLSDRHPEEIASDARSKHVRRVLYAVEEPLELHLSILEGIRNRYRTPFFDNLKKYANRPISTFHALPIARGKSIFKSAWISDMGEFYGKNLFLAESSATTGGLDSLLEPTGNIKEAQDRAAKAFGAEHCFFVTNGTSTSNKIVLMAVAKPGDIIIVDRNCHKSHHYGMVLGGLSPYYVEAFPMKAYSMYGAVPIRTIKQALLDLKKQGKLDKVRAVDLTNCTFDGHVYNVRRVMDECLAIKPDLVFLWDEAWFGFARWTPFLRHRTAMGAVADIEHWIQSDEGVEEYANQQAILGENPSDEVLLNTRLIPNPAAIRLRVYQTNSTHKSMSALRQGSMVLVHDIDFNSIEPQLHEAIFTHSTTSPNQQLIASLDIARRQMELEGYGLVTNSIQIALEIRKQINTHPIISKYFKVLGAEEMIPAEFRESGFKDFIEPGIGWDRVVSSIQQDEFFLDPTRLTLVCGTAGFDGTAFKGLLSERFSIQVNKTSRNSVLFQTNINNTRSDVANLLSVLLEIATEIDRKLSKSIQNEKDMFNQHVVSLMTDVPDLPNFSHFHEQFRVDVGDTQATEGNIREAFFMSWEAKNCEYVLLNSQECDNRLANGPEMISAKMVIPYPPGFPILVPGQVITEETIQFMRKLDVKEVHGYEANKGLQLIKLKD